MGGVVLAVIWGDVGLIMGGDAGPVVDGVLFATMTGCKEFLGNVEAMLLSARLASKCSSAKWLPDRCNAMKWPGW